MIYKIVENEKLTKENKRTTFENKRENFEVKRKAKAFDKIYKLLYDKFVYDINCQDVYGGSRYDSVKIGQWQEGNIKLLNLTEKETIKLFNLLLMGMGSKYYLQLNGYTGLNEENESTSD